MLSDMMGLPAYYYSVDGHDYKQETIDQIQGYRRNTILVRHFCLTPEELFQVTEPLGLQVIFLYRDPRDVMASSVNMRKYREGYRPGLPPFPDMDIREILKWEYETYGEFYGVLLPKWVEFNHHYLLKVRYEDLRKDAFSVLKDVSKFLNIGVKEAKLRQIVDENTFEKRTKRKAGQEDKSAHNRKGTIGDYKNQFSLKEQELLNNLLGHSLARMGYE